MNLAYHYGAKRIWIVNVGDLKPMEFPMEFFLTFARNPEAWPKEKLGQFTNEWAAREFGPAHASEIAGLISQYGKYNGRRKPELLDPATFSLVNYEEADRVSRQFRSAVKQADELYARLPENQREAYFQLVLFPLKASAQVTELYITAGKNQLYARQGRASASDLAGQARRLFEADADLSSYYNHRLSGGKWEHMMDQTHIGYTSWNEPPKNVMPEVVEWDVPEAAKMGVAIEGSASAWPGASEEPLLPPFDSFRRQRRFFDVFNRGRNAFQFRAEASEPWIALSQSSGAIQKEERLWISIDWTKAPLGTTAGFVKISASTGDSVTLKLSVFHPKEPARDSLRGFVESDGYVSIDAEDFTRKLDASSVRWEKIPDYGRTGSAMSIFPVNAASVTSWQKAACLEYQMYLFDPGKVEVEAFLAPTLNFVPGRGLRYAVSFDDQPAQTIDALERNSLADWATSVKDNIRISKSAHRLTGTGYHTLKFWMVDPGIVLEKLAVNLGGMKPSYLGPPASFRGSGLRDSRTRVPSDTPDKRRP